MRKFTTIEAAERLMKSMEVAINNMIDEVRKPVDPDINGASVHQADSYGLQGAPR